MSRYYWTGHVFVFRDVAPDVLDEWADAVVAELAATDARDVSVGGSLADGRVEFEFYVPAPGAERVIDRATAQMRTALDAVGARTSPALPVAEESVTVRRDPVPLPA